MGFVEFGIGGDDVIGVGVFFCIRGLVGQDLCEFGGCYVGLGEYVFVLNICCGGNDDDEID